MAVTLLQKYQTTAGQVPTSAQVKQRELLVNTTDGRVYTQKSDQTVVCINPLNGPAPLSTVFEFTTPLPAYTFVLQVPGASLGQSVMCSLDGTTTGSAFADEYEMEPMIVSAMVFQPGYVAFSIACCDSNMLTLGKKQINYYVG